LRLSRAQPGRHDPVPRRYSEGYEGRHVRRRRRDQGYPEGPAPVRDRPAAVPPGLPAGRVRRALRDEPQHRRQRRARADGAGLHHEGECGAGRRAGGEGDALGRECRGGRRSPAHPAVSMAQPAAAQPAHHDERLVRLGFASRLLTRPDIGAFLGAVAVFLAFGYFARAVDWLGEPAIAAGWTDQAAQYGIVAVPVALLMIGGEFDLSAGVMIGSSGLLLGYLTTHAGLNVWPAIALVLLFGLGSGLINLLAVLLNKLP